MLCIEWKEKKYWVVAFMKAVYLTIPIHIDIFI
jgi:hypothetical protein